MQSTVSIFVSALLLSLSISQAYARDDFKCEFRASPQRSKASVNFEGLIPGATYNATIASGANFAIVSSVAAPDGKFEVDADSNRRDILAGATAIATDFFQNGSGTVSVTDAMGTEVRAAAANCKTR